MSTSSPADAAGRQIARARFGSSPWLYALLAALAILAAEQVIEHFARRAVVEHDRTRVLQSLSTTRAHLEGVIGSHQLLVHGLTAVISAHPAIDQKEFSRIARGLVNERHALRNIAGAPDMVISLMYPMTGNEAALGLDYRTHPTQSADALRVMETGRAMLAGPLRLQQGGTAVVLREPVYVPGDTPGTPTRFWGLISAVIDIDRLYKLAGLTEPSPGLLMAIRDNATGTVFFGDAGVFDREPVFKTVVLPGGTWQLAAVPEQGWGRSADGIWMIRLLGLLAALTAGVLAYKMVRGARTLSDTAARLRSLLDTLPDLVWMKNPEGAYLGCNRRFELLYGADEQTIRGKTDHDFVPRELADFFREKDRAAMAAGGPTTNEEWLEFASDGHQELVETVKTPVYDPSGTLLGVLGIARDITERVRTAERLHQINRVHAMLSGINECIVRMRDPGRIFQEACRIAVERGGFRMAWIGLADADSGEVRPVASAGVVDGYLERLHISLGEDEHGRGPTATAIKQGRHVVCDDIAEDPRMAPWRDHALARGYRSSVGLPIQVGDKSVGVFSLYADQPHFFDQAELHLLDELAEDIGFALEFDESERARRQAELTLRDSETRYRSLLEQAPFPVVLTSMRDGTLLYGNHRAESQYGISKERGIGLAASRFYRDPDQRERFLGLLTENGRVDDFETQMETADGRTFWALISASVIQYQDTPAIFAAINDISARKEAENHLREQKEFFRLIAENMGDMVAVLDLDGRRLYNSPSYRALFGDPEALKGTDSFAEIHPDDRDRVHRVFLDTVATGVGHRTDFRFVLQNGEVREIESQGGVIRGPDGMVSRVVVVSRDVTERRRMEHEIRQLNTDLEARVRERTAELAAANKELETFSYSVSHDLKAPLRGIDGYSRLLQKEQGDRLDDEGRLFLSHIRHGVEQMSQLIEDLLAYSRMERRDLFGVRVDPARVIADLLAERRADLETRGVEVRLDIGDASVRADPDGLAMVLRNLIDNALKFSRNSQPPRLEITAETLPDTTILRVRDNGIGFDMRFKERIFEIFQRLQRAEDYPGTGVGLAIVQRAMHRMGGRVWVESAPGQGATFSIELPCPGSATGASSTPDPRSSAP